jgi:hypothetical protein
MKKCYLRQTKVKLLDGKEYIFRALPFNRRTVELFGRIEGAALSVGDSLAALLDAVELSLSFDQTEEEVKAILDGGLIPLSTDLSDPTLMEIMAALVIQQGEPKKKDA